MQGDIGNRFAERELLDVSACGTPGIFRVSKTRGILVTGRQRYLLRTRGGAFTLHITIGYRLLKSGISWRLSRTDRRSLSTFPAVVKPTVFLRDLLA